MHPFYYCCRKLAEAVPVLWAIATLTFFLARWVPGGPFDSEKALPPDVQAAIHAHYGLDKPILTQYWNYMKKLAVGDLGPSYKHEGLSVQELLVTRIPTSLVLGFCAIVLALLLGLSAGLGAALKQNTRWDYLLMGGAMVGICLPAFVLGPLVVLFFGLKLHWFSVGGWHKASDAVLPVLTLALLYTGYIARLFRASMLEVANQDYMRAAKAKGLPLWRIVCVHGIRNALAPVLNFLGPACASIISGSLIVETVFNIPGVGRLFLQAISDRDDPVVIGSVLFYALAVIIFNFLSEVALVYTNPKKPVE